MRIIEISNKKTGILIVKIEVYDKKIYKKLLKQVNKLKAYCNIREV